jgi:uncharacterized OB-fold protein
MNISKCPRCGVKLGNFPYVAACPHCHEELNHNTTNLLPVPIDLFTTFLKGR